jgi:hypothetical protein
MNAFSYMKPQESVEQFCGVSVLTELRKWSREDYIGEYAIVIPVDFMGIC